MFKTEEEAEKHLEYLKSLAILRDDAGDWKPDWESGQDVYYVFYNYTKKTLTVDYFSDQAMDIHFETEEAAQKSIDEHKKHWLRVLGVNDD